MRMVTLNPLTLSIGFFLIFTVKISFGSTVNFSDPGVAESIAGLNIDGYLYNVEFLYTLRRAELYNQLDFTTEPEARAAAVSITKTLNEFSAVSFLNKGLNTYNGNTYESNFAHDYTRIYFSHDLSNIYGVGITFKDNSWIVEDEISFSSINLYSYPYFVDFNLTAIPVPGTIWLFLSGLSFITRRRLIASTRSSLAITHLA